MKNRLWKTMTLMALLLLLPFEIFGAEIAVIGHKDFPKDQLTASDLKKVYLGQKTEEGGVKIKPFDQADNTLVKKQFISKILGASLGKYKAHWLKRIFREGVTPPPLLPTSNDVLQAVQKDKGAIGYLPADELSDTREVKVLLKFSTDK